MRTFNFSPGPATLPEAVLQRAANEMLDYNGTGVSVMEMSHRSPMYEEIHNAAVDGLKRLMNIPDNYKILFLHGGATSQFSMVPLNLGYNAKAAYAITGEFAKKSLDEAKKYTNAVVVSDSSAEKFAYVPEIANVPDDCAYLHITSNNTIFGTRYTQLPKTSVPIVSDASSWILSETCDMGDYAMMYAGAQKNIGMAGVTVVIIRDDLLERTVNPITPVMYNYALAAKNNSLYNTPTTYGVYLCKLVFDHLESIGGIAAQQKINEDKAALLYDAIDASPIFNGIAQKAHRSLMNVTFTSGDADTDARFCKLAAAEGMINLKGHRSAGGIRASIYNAMPVEGVRTLAQFVKEFQ